MYTQKREISRFKFHWYNSKSIADHIDFFLNESEIVNSLNLRMNSETVNILPKKLKLKTSTVPIDKK